MTPEQIETAKDLLSEALFFHTVHYGDQPAPDWITAAGVAASRALLEDDARALTLIRIHRNLVAFGHPANVQSPRLPLTRSPN